MGSNGIKRLVLPEVTEEEAAKHLSGADVESQMRRELLQKLKQYFETELKQNVLADMRANMVETGVGDGQVTPSRWKPPTIMAQGAVHLTKRSE